MKTEEEIFQEVVNLFERLFEIDPTTITYDSRLYEDLDMDSIDAIDLVIELNKKTGKKLHPDQFKLVRTVNDVIIQVKALVDNP